MEARRDGAGVTLATYAYDSIGRMVGGWPPTGQTHGRGAARVRRRASHRQAASEPGLRYDEEERLTFYTGKLGRTVVYAYDDAGRLETTTNRNGDVFSYSDNVAGRLETVRSTTAVTSTSSEPVVRSYTYDSLGGVAGARAGCASVVVPLLHPWIAAVLRWGP